MTHTLLLIQPGSMPETRTYCDYNSLNDCMEAICSIYKEHLRRLNPNSVTYVTYDITQLFQFIDHLNDLSCLVYQNRTRSYVRYNKATIKEKLHEFLRRKAN